jgi:hypothetical protein
MKSVRVWFFFQSSKPNEEPFIGHATIFFQDLDHRFFPKTCTLQRRPDLMSSHPPSSSERCFKSETAESLFLWPASCSLLTYLGRGKGRCGFCGNVPHEYVVPAPRHSMTLIKSSRVLHFFLVQHTKMGKIAKWPQNDEIAENIHTKWP